MLIVKKVLNLGLFAAHSDAEPQQTGKLALN